jgi:hypothetical protein
VLGPIHIAAPLRLSTSGTLAAEASQLRCCILTSSVRLLMSLYSFLAHHLAYGLSYTLLCLSWWEVVQEVAPWRWWCGRQRARQGGGVLGWFFCIRTSLIKLIWSGFVPQFVFLGYRSSSVQHYTLCLDCVKSFADVSMLAMLETNKWHDELLPSLRRCMYDRHGCWKLHLTGPSFSSIFSDLVTHHHIFLQIVHTVWFLSFLKLFGGVWA